MNENFILTTAIHYFSIENFGQTIILLKHLRWSVCLCLLVISQSPCISWPYRNNGTCAAQYEDNSYVCICKKGFKGKDCEFGKTLLSLLNKSPSLACLELKLTPISDHERISPYNVNAIPSRQVVRI